MSPSIDISEPGLRASTAPMPTREIEKKFLVRSIPRAFATFPRSEIVQGYVKLTHSARERRIRKETDINGSKFCIMLKEDNSPPRSGIGLDRTEKEKISLSEEGFNSHLKEAHGKVLAKTRYRIPYAGLTIELDFYHWNLEGLVIAEVEFESEEQAMSFKPPKWFGPEVSEEWGFRNSVLAREGFPQMTAFQRYLRKPKPAVKEPRELALDAGIIEAVRMIDGKLQNSRRPIMVGIAGASASGKSSAIATRIKGAYCDQAAVLSMDSYYLDASVVHARLKRGRKLNFDVPSAVSLLHLASDLDDLKGNTSIVSPVHEFDTMKTTWGNIITPKRVTIVEGLFTLREPILSRLDVKIFVDASVYGQMLRRVMRDAQRTGRPSSETLRYFLSTTLPWQKRYVDSSRANADLVIRNDYNSVVEAGKAGVISNQSKFKGIPSEEQLRQLGAIRVGTIVQSDRYYTTGFESNGEILRLRTEGGETVFSYKGPSPSKKVRRQPRLEFSLGIFDSELKENFESVFGGPIIVMRKERTAYMIDGVIIYIDKRVEIMEPQNVSLGEFTEICWGRQAGKKAKETIEKLELENPIESQYIDLALASRLVLA